MGLATTWTQSCLNRRKRHGTSPNTFTFERGLACLCHVLRSLIVSLLHTCRVARVLIRPIYQAAIDCWGKPTDSTSVSLFFLFLRPRAGCCRCHRQSVCPFQYSHSFRITNIWPHTVILDSESGAVSNLHLPPDKVVKWQPPAQSATEMYGSQVSS